MERGKRWLWRGAALVVALAAAAGLGTLGQLAEQQAGSAPSAAPVVEKTGRTDGAAAPSAETAQVVTPAGPCPEEMAQVEDFCVDRWEAHLVKEGEDGELVIHPYYARPEPGARHRARSAPGIEPQGYISRDEAAAACEEAEKRLCTFVEWRRACRGPEERLHPYGNDFEEGRCNQGKAHLMGQLHGRDPHGWTQSDLNDPRLLRDTGALTAAGEHERCVSPHVIYDMAGNLHEWVADSVTLPFMQSLAREGVYRRKQPWRIGNGIFLGGFFSTRGELGPGCLFTTVAHRPRYHDYSTGFRCCRAAAG